MKSDYLPAMPLLDENRPFKFSLGAVFLRLLRSSCSAKTLAVSAAVSSFLMASDGVSNLDSFDGSRPGAATPSILSAASGFLLGWVCFLFLLEPGAFFRECVRPSDWSFDNRSRSRSLSVGDTGRMGITFSVEYGSLH